jgi:transcriptional regulator with XRE-family HTH domain
MYMCVGTFSERLLWARRTARLTEIELCNRIESAHQLSVEASYISELESSKSHKKPTWEVVRAIALVLGMSMDYLAGLANVPSPSQEQQGSSLYSSPEADEVARLLDEMTQPDRILIAELVQGD